MEEEKLCPFRHSIDKVPENYQGNFWGFIEFGPCIREKCVMWRVGEGHTTTKPRKDLPGIIEDVWVEGKGYCGLAGKP